MDISIFVGDLTHAPAEALCTSTNPRLSLMMGTGAAVRDRGGYSILRECERILDQELGRSGTRALAPGSACVTTAGLLPHKRIIHCVASDGAHVTSASIIRLCVVNALACADAEECSTIAMPLFGTGHARFDFDEALKLMLRTIRETQTRVKRVFIVTNDASRVSGFGLPIELSQREEAEDPSWFNE
ncbi:MAG TPA: macro domain-containing protein [Thermoanaerobaculia bacterium]